MLTTVTRLGISLASASRVLQRFLNSKLSRAELRREGTER